MEGHLWLNLSGINDKDKSFLMDTPLSPPGVFNDSQYSHREVSGGKQAVSPPPLSGLIFELATQGSRPGRFLPRVNPIHMIKVEVALVPLPCNCVMLTTDASFTGWGAVLDGGSTQGLWRGHQLSSHINCLR